jgi:alkaline phosphatase
MNTLPVNCATGTNNVKGKTTDSAASGTAIACGTKTFNSCLGLDSQNQKIQSVAVDAKKQGMKVGIISTVQANHATPAAFYAHVPKRYMFNTITSQMAQSGFDFFGSSGLLVSKSKKPFNPQAVLKKAGYTLANTRTAMQKLKPGKNCVFMKYQYWLERSKDKTSPDLAELTKTAIRLLDNSKGFFIMVEGGKIDHASHANDSGTMYRETIELDNAIKVGLEFYKKHPQHTLVVVTADHETGGLQLLNNKNPEVELLAKQINSSAVIARYLNTIKNAPDGWNKALALIQKYYGFSKLTQDELTKLRQAWELFSNPKLKNKFKGKILYGRYNPVIITAQQIRDARCGIKWTTFGHTSTPIRTSAIGCNSKLFMNACENSDIAKLIRQAMISGK